MRLADAPTANPEGVAPRSPPLGLPPPPYPPPRAKVSAALEDADAGTFLLILGPADHVLAGRLDPGSLPGTLRPLDRKRALAYGQRAVADLFPGAHPEVWAAGLPLELPQTTAARLHVLVACAPDSSAPQEYAWHAPEAVGAARPEAIPWLRAAAHAVASVRDFPNEPGSRTPTPEPSHEPGLSFAELRRRARHANEILRSHLLAAEVPPAHAETLRQWSYRIPLNGISQAAAATTRRSRYPLSPDAANGPFNFNSEMSDAPLTAPAPPVPAQQSDFQPSSIRDILYPWAVSAIDAWFALEQADLLAYAADPSVPRRTNKPLVIDQDGFFPRAIGLFWDLRGAVQQLMRRDAPGTSRLNADAIRAAAGPAYPDQELLDGIQHGVRMPAEHQMCIVLLPNLISIAACMPQHHADVSRMEKERRRLPHGEGAHSLGARIHAVHPWRAPASGVHGQGARAGQAPPHHRRPAGAADIPRRHSDSAHQRQRAHPARRRQLALGSRAQAQVRPRARQRRDPQLGGQGAGGRRRAARGVPHLRRL
jgi:hypothetical protein